MILEGGEKRRGQKIRYSRLNFKVALSQQGRVLRLAGVKRNREVARRWGGGEKEKKAISEEEHTKNGVIAGKPKCEGCKKGTKNQSRNWGASAFKRSGGTRTSMAGGAGDRTVGGTEALVTTEKLKEGGLGGEGT